MIFVTVGTHEQPFNRIISHMDYLCEQKKIEEVIIQTGFSTYRPKFCQWKEWFSYEEMLETMKSARIIITHGGPSSFIMALQNGKIPIVIPRQKKFNEHINDHQVEFSKAVAERMGNIVVVENIEELEEIINKYEKITGFADGKIKSNNKRFNEEFEKLVNKILR